MKVTDKWYPDRVFDVESALLREMQDAMHSDGQFERLQAELTSTQLVLARFMAQHIKTLSQLNEVAGYNKYEEV